MFNGKISKHTLSAALLALVCSPVAVYAQSDKSPAGSVGESSAMKSASSQRDAAGAKESVSAADQSLIRDLAQANLAEIEAGKLAQGKSKNDEVKNFAQRMIDDHTKAQEDLQKLAQQKGVTLPTSPGIKHMAMTKMLSALSGDQFDRHYMARDGLADHKQTHELLQRIQSKAADADLKQLAAQMQPVVAQHMTMAQQTQASIKSTSETAAGASGAAGTTRSGAGGTLDSGAGGSSK